MAADTFVKRIDELLERVGTGTLRGSVEVDQAYAQYQHEGLDLQHPRGGSAKYLEQPLYDGHRTYLQHVADNVLEGDLAGAMADGMEDLADQVERTAPVEFTDLRGSGHPTVTSGVETTYDRPPRVPRLTPAQLRAKSELRRHGDGGFGDGMASLYGL